MCCHRQGRTQIHDSFGALQCSLHCPIHPKTCLIKSMRHSLIKLFFKTRLRRHLMFPFSGSKQLQRGRSSSNSIPDLQLLLALWRQMLLICYSSPQKFWILNSATWSTAASIKFTQSLLPVPERDSGGISRLSAYQRSLNQIQRIWNVDGRQGILRRIKPKQGWDHVRQGVLLTSTGGLERTSSLAFGLNTSCNWDFDKVHCLLGSFLWEFASWISEDISGEKESREASIRRFNLALRLRVMLPSACFWKTVLTKDIPCRMDVLKDFQGPDELEQYLEGLNPKYSSYAQEMWSNDMRSVGDLANASPSALQQCGIQHASHADIIHRNAKRAGKKPDSPPIQYILK